MTKTKNAKLDRTNQKELPLFLTLIFLWGQLYFTAIPTWRYANYYEYGWFVPPLALFFLFKHWKNFPPVEPKPKGETNLLLIAGLLLPFLVLIRILEGVDASWRPPILLHALLVVLSSHWIIWHFKGRATSLKLVPVTLFALSAIPYPYQLEVRVIGFLTNWVVQAAGLIFHLLGKAVIVTNGIIEYGGTKVEVTEGCSGIQSLQSLIMVSLYFGEFFRMKLSSRIFLFTSGIILACFINIGRAIYLAHIRFEEGAKAFDAAHDNIGHIAFAIGGLLLLLISWTIINFSSRTRTRVKRT